MTRSVRPLRAGFSFLVLALGAAVVAMAARRASGCTMDGFTVTDGLNADRAATAGQSVTFRVSFDAADARTANISVTYGDGTGEQVPHNLQSVFGQRGAFLTFTHVYTRVGTFDAVLRGSSMSGQACFYSGYFGLGLVVDGKPAIRVKVVENPVHSRVKHVDPAPTAAWAQPKSAVSIAPGSAARIAGANETTAREKSIVSSALHPGQIARASVSSTPLGSVLKIEGSGKCGLRAVEDVDGKVVKTYDYKGIFPASIALLNTLPGLHGITVESDKTTEGCGGAARTSFAVARRRQGI
jgi:hypothetical protein